MDRYRGKEMSAFSPAGERIASCGLVPIFRFQKLDQAMKVAEALHNADVDIVEFPMTSPLALQAIEKVKEVWGDNMLVGAGTVLSGETARACVLAGAQFIVTPSFKEEIAVMCKQYSVALCMGALTPTEVAAAWEAGADFVKIFPCGNVGGPDYIRQLKAPFPHIRMIPVGGVTFENAADFIHAGSAALGAGNGLIDPKAVSSERYDAISRNASRFTEIIKSARSNS
jgi:2-dehydro-3-deoxyphosphogluconate aldolase / (4S)-4-hydroxy-2-oxoglutarate aldolase